MFFSVFAMKGDIRSVPPFCHRHTCSHACEAAGACCIFWWNEETVIVNVFENIFTLQLWITFCRKVIPGMNVGISYTLHFHLTFCASLSLWCWSKNAGSKWIHCLSPNHDVATVVLQSPFLTVNYCSDMTYTPSEFAYWSDESVHFFRLCLEHVCRS